MTSSPFVAPRPRRSTVPVSVVFPAPPEGHELRFGPRAVRDLTPVRAHCQCGGWSGRFVDADEANAAWRRVHLPSAEPISSVTQLSLFR